MFSYCFGIGMLVVQKNADTYDTFFATEF